MRTHMSVTLFCCSLIEEVIETFGVFLSQKGRVDFFNCRDIGLFI